MNKKGLFYIVAPLFGLICLAFVWLQFFTTVNFFDGIQNNDFVLIGLGVIALIVFGIIEIVTDTAFE